MDKVKPKISIIMNCHNGEKYLHFSLQSIINQTYKNWELIFWDNNSKDRSKKIISNFKDKRIKYFYTKKFYTLYKSRNLALSKAKGDFFCFIDVDDLWNKNKLHYQVNFLKKKNLLICFSDLYILNNSNQTKIIYNNKNIYKTDTQNLINNYKLAILTVMFHKSIFKKKKFNNSYSIIGDFDYFINLSFNYKLGYINKPLATYRVHESNYSKKNSLYFNELKKWIIINKNRFKKHKLSLAFIKVSLFKLGIKSFVQKFFTFLGM